MIAIETYTPSHQQGVVGVILPIQQEEFELPITLEAQPDLLDVEAFYQHGIGNFWVALDDDEVVGTIALLDIGGGDVALRKMFVKQGYRGSTHGVARTLLRKVMEWSEAHGVRDVYLGTTAKFLAAHRFYEKNGFLGIAKEALPHSFPIMQVDTKFYCRHLDRPGEARG